MANIRNANTFYIDTAAADTAEGTTGNLAIKNIKVSNIIIHASGGAASVILKDVTTGDLKLEIGLANDNETLPLDFEDTPMLFPNGISPTTVTNATITCLLKESRS